MSSLLKWWPILLLGFGIGSWAIAQEMGQKTLEQRTATIAEGVEQLQKIHISEDAMEKGREKEHERIRKMCEDGRVTGDICEE